MLRGIENIRQYFNANKVAYWKLKNNSGDNMSFSDLDNTNMQMTEALQLFEDAYNILESGRYFLESWAKHGDTKNHLKIYFEKPTENKSDTPAPAIGYTNEDVETLVKKRLDEYMQGLEMERIKAENKRLQDELRQANAEPSGMDKFFSKLADIPQVSEVIGALLSPQSKNQIGNIKKKDMSNTQQENDINTQVQNAMTAWAEKEPDFAQIIIKLSQMCVNNDPMYSTAKQILLGR